MALQKISFDLLGDKQYVRGFEAMASEVADLREPFEEIGEQLRLSVSEQFRTEGAHGAGGKWQALNPAYERWKRAEYGDQPILVATGKMRAAAISRDAITVTPRQLIYEIDDPKAIHHQRGDEPLPSNPARKLVDLSLTDRRGWDRSFAEWLNRIRRGPIWT